MASGMLKSGVKAGIGKLWGGKKKKEEGAAFEEVKSRGDDFNIIIKKPSDTETDKHGKPIDEILAQG